jgi:thiol-disulfide isomerase/thioredoxin
MTKPKNDIARIAALVCLLLVVACGNESKQEKGLTLTDLRGQTVLVNYWATWCAPCREEIPALNRLQANNPELKVVGVNFDGVTGDDLSAQVEQLGIAFPTLSVDPRAALGLAPIEGLPETLIIDQQGNLLAVMQGPQTEASLEAKLGEVLR